jgi:hypothetical protein
MQRGGGKITRKAYTRKSYSRKSGIHVKGSRVTARRIRDMGAPGKWASLHGPGIGAVEVQVSWNSLWLLSSRFGKDGSP